MATLNLLFTSEGMFKKFRLNIDKNEKLVHIVNNDATYAMRISAIAPNNDNGNTNWLYPGYELWLKVNENSGSKKIILQGHGGNVVNADNNIQVMSKYQYEGDHVQLGLTGSFYVAHHGGMPLINGDFILRDVINPVLVTHYTILAKLIWDGVKWIHTHYSVSYSY